MKLELKIYDALCATEVFRINGIKADGQDFGDKGDRHSSEAEAYSCADMHFTPKDPEPEVLKKYGIEEGEYWIIARQLEKELSFGSCGWCV